MPAPQVPQRPLSPPAASEWVQWGGCELGGLTVCVFRRRDCVVVGVFGVEGLLKDPRPLGSDLLRSAPFLSPSFASYYSSRVYIYAWMTLLKLYLKEK